MHSFNIYFIDCINYISNYQNLPMKKFNTQFVGQTPFYSPKARLSNQIQQKYQTSLEFVHFQKGKENTNNNDQSQSSSRLRNPYRPNEELRQSVHELFQEMEHALDPRDQKKEVDKYYERKMNSGSLERSPHSNEKRMLSTMEIGSHQKRNEDLITDRTQKSNVSFKGLGLKPAIIKIRSLPELQISVTQQILMLREQKITLMHKKNAIIDQKNDIFRQVSKLKKFFLKQAKRKDQQSLHSDQKQDDLKRKQALQDQNQYFKNKIQEYQEIFKINLSLQEERSSQQIQQKLLVQVQKYQRLCQGLQDQIKKNQRKFDVSRFQTFLPSQKEDKSFQQKISEDLSSKVIKQQSSQQNKKNKLWNNESLLQLREINRKLMNEANTMIANKRRHHINLNVSVLEQIVELNKMIKQGFFQEVRCYKMQIPKLKAQNMKMKRALHNF